MKKQIGLIILTAVLAFAVGLACGSFRKVENTAELSAKLTKEIGSLNISDLSIAQSGSHLDVTIDYERLIGDKKGDCLLYVNTCLAVRQGVLSDKNYKEVSDVTIHCFNQKGEQAETMSSGRNSTGDAVARDQKTGKIVRFGTFQLTKPDGIMVFSGDDAKVP